MTSRSKDFDCAGASVKTGVADNIHAQAALLDTWNQEYSQVTCGKFDGSVTSISNERLRLFVEDMNLSVLQHGEVRPGNLGFGIPISLDGDCNLCGEQGGKGDLLVFSGHSGFEFLSPEGFRFVGVEINLLETGSPSHHEIFNQLRSELSKRRRSIHLCGNRAQTLAASFQQALEVLEQTSTGEMRTKQIEALSRQIMGNVLDCLSSWKHESASPQAAAEKHWSIVNDIRELVYKNPECPLSVAELAIKLGVSRRSIQNACNNILGISPVSYLRALRLSEVRREIEHAPSVTEAATRWGFWHFGNFARDYRQMFGELPSATLKRRPIV